MDSELPVWNINSIKQGHVNSKYTRSHQPEISVDTMFKNQNHIVSGNQLEPYYYRLTNANNIT